MDEEGTFEYHADRPTIYGLETHLSIMQKNDQRIQTGGGDRDPVSNLNAVANNLNVKMMLTRLLDQLKLDGLQRCLRY